MFDKKSVLATLSLKSAEGNLDALASAVELEKLTRYEDMINDMDDDELA